MKNTKSIKQVLSEALGVPKNIVELSSALYDVLVDSIPDTVLLILYKMKSLSLKEILILQITNSKV
jgi:hypothetical protein